METINFDEFKEELERLIKNHEVKKAKLEQDGINFEILVELGVIKGLLLAKTQLFKDVGMLDDLNVEEVEVSDIMKEVLKNEW